MIKTEEWARICPVGIFAAEHYLAVSILAKRSVTKVDAAIVQSARLRDVGVANRKKNLHAEKEKPKNFPLKERFLGLDDIHVIEFAKGNLIVVFTHVKSSVIHPHTSQLPVPDLQLK